VALVAGGNPNVSRSDSRYNSTSGDTHQPGIGGAPGNATADSAGGAIGISCCDGELRRAPDIHRRRTGRNGKGTDCLRVAKRGL